MRIELTEAQARAMEDGKSLELVDPISERKYLAVPQVPPEKETGNGTQLLTSLTGPKGNLVPPGIRRAQEAYWRDLQELLKLKSNTRRWVAYHGERRIGFGKTSAELYKECIEQHGLRSDDFYVDRLAPRSLPPWEAEEIDAPFGGGEAVVNPPSDTPA